MLITQAAIRYAQDGPSVVDPNINPDDVTPGVVGFVFTLVFALVVILLGLDLYRRVRRMQYREQVKEEIEAELAEGPESSADESLNTDQAPEFPADGADSAGADDAPTSPDADPRV